MNFISFVLFYENLIEIKIRPFHWANKQNLLNTNQIHMQFIKFINVR